MNFSDTTTLNLPCGPVTVNVNDDLIYARGIPYTHAKRFQPPTPAKWTSPLNCTGPATIFPQVPSRISIMIGDITGDRPQSEDSLHVTISAPKSPAPLPVMVWFHGGAYMSGGGDLDAYNPLHLSLHGVVVVNVTYRLSHFGFLPIPDIAPANLALLDKIEALKWVQTNIHIFNGDPNNVTIFGQSAGADAIICLLTIPSTQSLFHRAIIQSAPMSRLTEAPETQATRYHAMGAIAKDALTSTPAMTTAQFQSLQPKLLAAAPGTYLAFHPLFGQHPLPPIAELRQRIQERAKTTPVMIGYTSHEGSAFAALNPVKTADEFTEVDFRVGADELRGWVEEVRGPSPSYEFVWHPTGNEWGAGHCIELPFLFGGSGDGSGFGSAWEGAPFLEGCDETEVERLGGAVRRLWSAFAKGRELGGRRFVIDAGFEFDD